MFPVARTSSACSILSRPAILHLPRPLLTRALHPSLPSTFHRYEPPHHWEHKPHPLWNTVCTPPAATQNSSDAPIVTAIRPEPAVTPTIKKDNVAYRKAIRYAKKAKIAARKAEQESASAKGRATRRASRAAIRAQELAERAADAAAKVAGTGIGLSDAVMAARKAARAAQQLTSLKFTKVGDLLLLKSVQPRLMHLVTEVTDEGRLYSTTPKFSVDGKPGTWSLEGARAYYTPTSDPGGLTEEERKKVKMLPEDAWGSIAPHAQGIKATLFKNKCPWKQCNGGFVRPGYKDTEFPDFVEDMGAGVACPVCLGREFAHSDMEEVRELRERFLVLKEQVEAQGVKPTKGTREELKEAWGRRLERINKQRHVMCMPGKNWGGRERRGALWGLRL